MAVVSGTYIPGAPDIAGSSSPIEDSLWGHAVPLQAEQNLSITAQPFPPSSNDRTPAHVQQQLVAGFAPDNSRSSTELDDRSDQDVKRAFVGRYQDSAYWKAAPGGNTIKSYSSSRPGADRYHEKSGERTRVKRKGLHGIVTAVDEKDMDSKWIHRDKLAQIEKRELAEMGLSLRRSSHRGGKVGRKPSKVMVTADLWEDTVEGQEEEQLEFEHRQLESRRMSTDIVAGEFSNHHPIGQDEGFTRQMTQLIDSGDYTGRPTISRIPVYKNNPVADTGLVEKHSPVLRSRHDSVGWASLNDKSGDQKVGGRTGITGNQSLLDAATGAQRPDPTYTSTLPEQHSQTPRDSLERRIRVASGRATPPNSGVRKVSVARGPSDARRRTTSATTGVESPRRPTTSGDSRPATARPNGEAPWIATMYKPDPRLPPEEQMLPTHAKRLALEQQEHESEPPSPSEPQQISEFTTYNSEEEHTENRDQLYEDFPRSEKTSNYHLPDESESHLDPGRLQGGFQRSSRNADNLLTPDYTRNLDHTRNMQDSEKRQSEQWPLRTPPLSARSVRPFSNAGSDTGSWRNGRVSANGHEHGGYSVMPTIQSQKEMEQRLSLRPGVPPDRLSTANSQYNHPRTEPIRVLDTPEPEKNDTKGCAKFCIVM